MSIYIYISLLYFSFMNAVSLLFLYFSYMNLYMFRYVKSYLFFKLFKLNKFIYVSKVLKLLLYSSGVNSNLFSKR